jgi:hypothetical protein
MPPLDSAAEATIAAMRSHLAPRQPVLTAQDRADAEQAAAENRYCLYCGGIHAGPTTPACPRLASFKVDGDGKITEGTFWEGTAWAEGRVILAEQAAEDEEDGDGGE